MKTAILALFIFVMANNTCSAVSTPQCNYMDSLDFQTRINSIHSKAVDLTNIFVLHHIKEFNEIYFNPLDYKSEVLNYLKTSAHPEKKMIAICSMTKLPTNQYIDLLSKYYDLYCNHRINDTLLDRSLFNEFDTEYRIARYYKNPKIKDLLGKMLNSKHISKELKTNIKETLNGKWYHDLKRTGRIK